MKQIITIAVISLFVSTAFAGGFNNANHHGPSGGHGSGNDALLAYLLSLPSETVDAQEEEALMFMIQEEKLARDVYIGLFEQWGLRIFENIAAAEQSHMDALSALLEKYGLVNPVAGVETGVFADDEFDTLYSDLMGQGSLSLMDSLLTGAFIEELDIVDLEDRIARTDNQDIQVAFQNLLKGSRNHLRAFVRVLDRNSEDDYEYAAQVLTQDEVDAIIAAQWERGPVDADGIPVFAPGRIPGRGFQFN